MLSFPPHIFPFKNKRRGALRLWLSRVRMGLTGRQKSCSSRLVEWHGRGDWGNMLKKIPKPTTRRERTAGGFFSAYNLPEEGGRVWIITEAKRSTLPPPISCPQSLSERRWPRTHHTLSQPSRFHLRSFLETRPLFPSACRGAAGKSASRTARITSRKTPS